MAISRSDRRTIRSERALRDFGDNADAALDLLELTELAWHDCYCESTPGDDVIEDIFVVAQGDLSAFIAAARPAVEDFRDLRLEADQSRS